MVEDWFPKFGASIRKKDWKKLGRLHLKHISVISNIFSMTNSFGFKQLLMMVAVFSGLYKYKDKDQGI